MSRWNLDAVPIGCVQPNGVDCFLLLTKEIIIFSPILFYECPFTSCQALC